MEARVGDSELLQRIEGFDIDGEPCALPFEQRLALENGWRLSFAERVVIEYKRFVFLAMAAGHPVTPSEAVDEAWHLHLTYTDSYWNRFCRDVLPKPLHHNPTKGGAAEDAKFFDWYGKTLESYRRLIASEPPADIWPSPRERFARGIARIKMNPVDFWFVRKPQVRSLTITGLAFAAGCTSIQFEEVGAVEAVFIGGIIGVAVFAIIRASRSRNRRGTGQRNRSSCGSGGSWSGGCSGHTGRTGSSGDGPGIDTDGGGSGDSGGGCGSSGCGGAGCGGGGD